MRPECPLDTTSRSDNMRRLNHTNLNMTFYGQHKLENSETILLWIVLARILRYLENTGV